MPNLRVPIEVLNPFFDSVFGIPEKSFTQVKLTQLWLSQSKLSKGDVMAFRGREHELSLMK